MALLMALKLINNTLTLFFGENGCKTDTDSQYLIKREIFQIAKILGKVNLVREESSHKWISVLAYIRFSVFAPIATVSTDGSVMLF